MSKLCHCGSGEYRRELKDAAGIFCTFVCDKCEREKRQHFDPAIFDVGSVYARTGEEDDIGSALWCEHCEGYVPLTGECRFNACPRERA